MAAQTTVCPQCALEYEGGEVFCPNDGARLGPKAESRPGGRSTDPLLGQILGGRYRIIRKIGEGGMGIVYEAEHIVIEKRVGLKVLREDFSSRQDVVERFRQEAKSASRIGHEHIIDISDFGETPNGASYFVMELLNGQDLAHELEKKGPLSPRRTITLCLQCARALGAAHAKGIVHRDMKPENIFMVNRDTGEDFVKIVDFGIAKMSDIETDGQPGRKLTKTGMIFGTPEYMSPEQASGKKLDHRVDVYAMGVIMYELLTGRVPFVGDTFMGILTQHMFEQPQPLKVQNPNCNVPPDLERIVFKALAKDADQRYQNMEELIVDLTNALNRAPNSAASIAPPPGTVTHHGYQEKASGEKPAARLMMPSEASEFPGREASRNNGPKFMILGAVAAVLVGGAGAVLMRGKSEEAPAVAQQPPAIPATGSVAVPVLPSTPSSAPPSAPVPSPEPVNAVPAKVLVSVQTDPPGATISVDGKAGCDPTPCSFSVVRDSLVTVEASKSGFRTAKTELKAEHDPTAVQLVLRKRAAASSSGGSNSGGDDELKLPDAFAPSRRGR
ncbi:MAG: serine/threonine-protein kinase [Myxococcales bacterium]